MENSIFWITSYPKSGNTWMRAIISSLFYTKDGIFKFELFKKISMFETMEKFEYIKQINKNDYKKLEDENVLAKYWLQTQENLNIEKNSFIFLKTHHSCIKIDGKPFTNEFITKGLIYIVRDPRDIAISYSNHSNVNLDNQIMLMKKGSFYKYNSTKKNIKGLLLPWDKHIESWKGLDVPKIFIKYEDMINNPKFVIHSLINFFSQNYKANFQNINNKITNIIKSTTFQIFSNYEKNNGFNEATEHSNFFRSGKHNQWKTKLNKLQIKLIEDSFEKEMKKYNYL